jgi:DNA-binding transcriptional LysR family regulator
MLPVDDIRFFLVLVKAGSLAAAAREINVTPQAVTQRLQQIEARLGVRLIDRSKIKYPSF